MLHRGGCCHEKIRPVCYLRNLTLVHVNTHCASWESDGLLCYLLKVPISPTELVTSPQLKKMTIAERLKRLRSQQGAQKTSRDRFDHNLVAKVFFKSPNSPLSVADESPTDFINILALKSSATSLSLICDR